jgi:hypothetical protein
LSESDLHIITWANEIKKGGLFLIASAALGQYNEGSICMRQSLETQWTKLIQKSKIKALSVTSICPTLREGLRQAVMLTGLGKLRPNTLVIEWHESNERDIELPGIFRDIRYHGNMTLLVARNFASVSPANIFTRYTRDDDADFRTPIDEVPIFVDNDGDVLERAPSATSMGSGGGGGGGVAAAVGNARYACKIWGPSKRVSLKSMGGDSKKKKPIHWVDVLAVPVVFGQAGVPDHVYGARFQPGLSSLSASPP